MSINIRSKFLQEYSYAIEHNAAAVFAGAGMSSESGYVSWKSLLRTFANDIRLDVDKETDLISLAQYYKNEMGGRNSLNQELINQFTKQSRKNRYLNALAKLPIKSYWTTNYDTVIEDTLRNNFSLNVDVKITQESLALIKKDSNVTVYKFHGGVSMPEKAVLTKDDYELFTYSHRLFITALQGELVSKTFLYIGYSFNDPNLEAILSQIRILIGENQLNHYCIIRKIQKKDYNSEQDYIYDLAKQELKAHDLVRYGIHTIFIDNYDEIIDILSQLYVTYITRRIFIAGSCRNYGKWEKSNAYSFLYRLGYTLIKKDYIISSGFVEGVGPQVVNGALTAINELHLNVEKYLQIKPLPLIDGKADYIESTTKKMFQQDMISQAGIIIFLFGNQYYDGQLCNSKGVWEDFERAIKANKYIIPVGVTGFTALQIQNILEERADQYNYLKPFWDSLRNETNPEKLVHLIVSIVDSINHFI